MVKMKDRIIRSIRRGTVLAGIARRVRLLLETIAWKKRAIWDIRRSVCDLSLPSLHGPCAVFGSAPSASIPKSYDDSWLLISAGSSQYITEKLGLKIPDLTVSVCSTFIYDTEYIKEYCKGALLALSNKRTKGLIINEDKFVGTAVRKKRNLATLQRIGDINYQYESIQFMSWPYRFKLLTEILGDKRFNRHVVSTGLFSALLALRCGARPIVLSGFSFAHNFHGYPDDEFNKPNGLGGKGRGELVADVEAVKIIIKNRWPIYAAEESFASQSGLELWDPHV